MGLSLLVLLSRDVLVHQLFLPIHTTQLHLD